uniref:Uncharacterized protein n=1 Tax=Romanomermis culicivorax TaxID=13658 RepID=A0A915HJU9_ROMCU
MQGKEGKYEESFIAILFRKSSFVNENEISALFIERDSDGQFMNYFEIEVESILVHEDYRLYPVNYGVDVVALIKLKKAVQIPQTMAPIAISDQPVSNVSRCFVVARLGVGRIYTRRVWNLKDRDVYVKEAGLNDPITLVDVETHPYGQRINPYGQRIKADVFKSEEKSLLR